MDEILKCDHRTESRGSAVYYAVCYALRRDSNPRICERYHKMCRFKYMLLVVSSCGISLDSVCYALQVLTFESVDKFLK